MYEEAVKSVVAGEPCIYADGTAGTPTTAQLAQVISEVEGRGHDCRTALVPSGKHAIIAVFLSFLSSGDHVLISDSVYGPARIFAEDELTRFGLEVERSEEHTSELQSLMRISYAVFCLKKKTH